LRWAPAACVSSVTYLASLEVSTLFLFGPFPRDLAGPTAAFVAGIGAVEGHARYVLYAFLWLKQNF